MAASVEVLKIEGLRELKDALQELPKATSKNVMKRVLTKRGKPIAENASALARKKTGTLKLSFKVGTKLSRRQRKDYSKEGPDDVEVFVGPSPLVQAITEEFGTDLQAAHPMLRPAWSAGKRQVLEGIAADMWDEIKKAAERKARRDAKKAAAGG